MQVCNVRIHQLYADYMRPFSEKKRIKAGFQDLYVQMREAVRNTGHFVRFERVLRQGIKYYGVPLEDQPWT